MNDKSTPVPDSTAVRVALWRAMHVQIDDPPHILEDEVGLQLAAPEDDWRTRPDMNPEFTKIFRASIVARERFVEDLVIDKAAHGLKQYVLLGAGLDSFAQRRTDVASNLTVFEIERPAPQEWKKQRLIELGYGIPDWLRFVPVDFEQGESWWQRIKDAGFNPEQPSVVASMGVSMYISKDATIATLRQVACFAPKSTLIMSFLLPVEDIPNSDERTGLEFAIKGSRASGTPFISFYTLTEMQNLAHVAGFKKVQIVTGADLAQKYFAGRKDKLTPGNSEALLVANT